MKNSTLTKKKQRASSAAQSQAALDSFAKVSISVMAGVSALIGIWAVSCFVGALLNSGGPLQFVYGWFRAVSGL